MIGVECYFLYPTCNFMATIVFLVCELWVKFLSNLHFLGKNQDFFQIPGLPDGVHNNHPCPSISPLVRPSVFEYLGDRPLVFSNFLHEVKAP